MDLTDFFELSPEVLSLADRAEELAKEQFREIEETARFNSAKVLSSFRRHRVSDSLFAGTTGYGYDDEGRDTLGRVYADIFGAEAGLVRIGLVNGTHAIACSLFAVARPGRKLLYVTGEPYDTIQATIGITDKGFGSLRDYGALYGQVEMRPDGTPDPDAIRAAVEDPAVNAVCIQRSKGYSTRPSLSVDQIREICETVKGVRQDVVIFVDNCYGEFVERLEPTQVGADLMAGSLIKNPGGGIAPCGGYIVGRQDLVDTAAARMTAPGLGGECGASLGNNRLLFQGLFLAPHTVSQAVKTAVFCAAVMELMGYAPEPRYCERRHDIIQMVRLGTPENIVKFCRGLQSGSPVDAFAVPEPGDMPGYDCPVIMAAGAFIQGSSIELSADAPMREPYTVYMQGGVTYESGRLGILLAAQALLG